MNYRILGEPIENYPNYRGINREEPMLIEDSINQECISLWEWYANKTGDGGFIDDISKATRLINIYNKLGYKFELIRIASKPSKWDHEEFLGIDIGNLGGESLMSLGLNFEDLIKNPKHTFTNADSLLLLLQRYFQPKLNESLLFINEIDALFFLDVINQIKVLCPILFEDTNYEVLYIYKVNL